MRLGFTGHPFVDAGVAAMCAAADVSSAAELDESAVKRAVAELTRLMASSSAFKERFTGKKKTTFATSEMSVIFPNGPHANPSGKAHQKARRYTEKIERKCAASGSEGSTHGESCFVSGGAAAFRVGNDEFPLVDSKGKRNFHPGHQEGHAVSAATALALEFFPLSVLRSGVDEGLFWFIHTADEELAIACSSLTRRRMNELIARGDGLGFFGDWEVAARTPEAAFVALIRDVMRSGGQGALTKPRISASELPVTAYVFSNDNRSPEVNAQDLPHELFGYFGRLQGSETGAERFQREVLRDEYACWRVARAMLRREEIVLPCCVPAAKGQPARLRGGWEAHSVYATEVMGLSGQFIRAVEAVSARIAEHDDGKKAVVALRSKAVPVTSALRWIVRREMMTEKEYQTLVPPENRSAPFVARDYLLAAVFEREHARARGRAFLPWPGEPEPTEGKKHPMLVLTERIGEQLLGADRGRIAANDLARATHLSELRGVFREFVRRGYAAWNDFVYLFPPEPDGGIPAFAVRDYLLVFLYTRLRDPELPEAAPIPEGGIA